MWKLLCFSIYESHVKTLQYELEQQESIILSKRGGQSQKPREIALEEASDAWSISSCNRGWCAYPTPYNNNYKEISWRTKRVSVGLENIWPQCNSHEENLKVKTVARVKELPRIELSILTKAQAVRGRNVGPKREEPIRLLFKGILSKRTLWMEERTKQRRWVIRSSGGQGRIYKWGKVFPYEGNCNIGRVYQSQILTP